MIKLICVDYNEEKVYENLEVFREDINQFIDNLKENPEDIEIKIETIK